MSYVNELGKLIGNNYDITGTPVNEDILNLGVVLKSCTLRRSILSIIIIVIYFQYRSTKSL